MEFVMVNFWRIILLKFLKKTLKYWKTADISEEIPEEISEGLHRGISIEIHEAIFEEVCSLILVKIPEGI